MSNLKRKKKKLFRALVIELFVNEGDEKFKPILMVLIVVFYSYVEAKLILETPKMNSYEVQN